MFLLRSVLSLRNVHGAQVTESGASRLSRTPCLDILPHTLSFLALKSKSGPSLTQSKAYLCRPTIISHSIFQGKVRLCETQDDLMK